MAKRFPSASSKAKRASRLRTMSKSSELKRRGVSWSGQRVAMDEIADRCGFTCSDVLARSFTKVLQLTPGEYRHRFRSSGIWKMRMSQTMA
jgi:AraC-like DNA-binding protein